MGQNGYAQKRGSLSWYCLVHVFWLCVCVCVCFNFKGNSLIAFPCPNSDNPFRTTTVSQAGFINHLDGKTEGICEFFVKAEHRQEDNSILSFA